MLADFPFCQRRISLINGVRRMLKYDVGRSQVKRAGLELYRRNRAMRDARGWNGASSDPQSAEVMTIELNDLDSFTFIQLTAELEELYTLPLLRNMSVFGGQTFDDL